MAHTLARPSERVTRTSVGRPLENSPPGPSAGDVAAAEDMSDEDRQEMIRGMVEGLAERLSSEGGTAEEWARLITALGVLGETERAGTILAEARQVFWDDAAGLSAIEAAGERAGLSE